jgi:hypothetical protein
VLIPGDNSQLLHSCKGNEETIRSVMELTHNCEADLLLGSVGGSLTTS